MSDSCYPSSSSRGNPDVLFRFSPICHYVDQIQLKPNRHGHLFSFVTKRRTKSVTDSNYLSINGCGTSVARRENLLLSDFQEVAQTNQVVHLGKDPT
jgi:hypothetical protein